jgi:hypothetical protein
MRRPAASGITVLWPAMRSTGASNEVNAPAATCATIPGAQRTCLSACDGYAPVTLDPGQCQPLRPVIENNSTLAPAAREVAMSGQFEQRLDLALETRQQRLRQKQAKHVAAEQATQEAHAILERMQLQFCGEIRSLIEQAVERANRHLAKRPEKCRLCEVSGYLTGPLFVGGATCNPIAFELRASSDSVGETLVVELTHRGMIEAFLGPSRPGEPQAHTTRLDFGWEPIPLQDFGADEASDLVLRYVNAVTIHLPLDRIQSRAATRIPT